MGGLGPLLVVAILGRARSFHSHIFLHLIKSEQEVLVRSHKLSSQEQTSARREKSMDSWFFWALLSATFAALTAIFTKIGLKDVEPDYATLIPAFVIALVIGGYVYFTDKWSSPFALRPRTLSFLILSGLATSASWVCYFRALKLGAAAEVVPVDKLSLVLVVIFAFVFLGERPSIREWLGILLVGTGVVTLGWKR
jgi:bacterial/archaeal transporter family protein